MNNIPLLVIILISISILFLIVFSLHNLKTNKEVAENSFSKKDYVLSSNSFLLIILIGLFNIILFNLLDIYLDDVWAYLITIFGGNALIGILGILPILNLADKYPEKVAKVLKYLIYFFTYLLLPLSSLYIIIRRLVFKPVKVKMTEDEFLDIIDKAELEDGINENEKDLIKSVLDFDDLKVLDIYTPRIDIIAIEESMSNDEIVDIFKKSGLSRLPVYEKSIDNIIGTINHKDFYNDVLLGKKNIGTIIQKPVEVPEYMAAKNLLTLLKSNQSHIAIVKDEFGGTLGIVTMEDVLEELVGDIFDEHDKLTNNIRKLNDHKFLVLGSTYLDELEEALNLDLTELEEEDYLTVNGWVLSSLGKMGKAGDHFKYNNLSVFVRRANNKMILEVEVNILVD